MSELAEMEAAVSDVVSRIKSGRLVWTEQQKRTIIACFAIVIRQFALDAKRLAMLSAPDRRIPHAPRLDGSRMDLAVLRRDDQRSLNLFRFNISEIDRICLALHLPPKIVTPSRYSASSTEAMCIFLFRLAHAPFLLDMAESFGRSEGSLSEIVNTVGRLIEERVGHLLTLDVDRIARAAPAYAAAIFARGAPLNGCWGFIDGTARHIARPSVDQEIFYSGHERAHSLKFLSIVTPDGLVSMMLGPYEGRHHDSYMFKDIAELLERIPEGYYLYGDSGFPTKSTIVSPYRDPLPDEKAFNLQMSQVRVCVEWMFGRILALFPLLTHWEILRINQSPVAAYYRTAVLLTNFRTILDGRNEVTDQFFGVSPLPTLEEYVAERRPLD